MIEDISCVLLCLVDILMVCVECYYSIVDLVNCVIILVINGMFDYNYLI